MVKEVAAFEYDEERQKFRWDIPADYNFVEVIHGWSAGESTKPLAITEYPDGRVEQASLRQTALSVPLVC